MSALAAISWRRWSNLLLPAAMHRTVEPLLCHDVRVTTKVKVTHAGPADQVRSTQASARRARPYFFLANPTRTLSSISDIGLAGNYTFVLALMSALLPIKSLNSSVLFFETAW